MFTEKEINSVLKSCSTKDLTEELRGREGVKATVVGPYEDIIVETNGPAIVLEIID